jgi:TnpA family transposase
MKPTRRRWPKWSMRSPNIPPALGGETARLHHQTVSGSGLDAQAMPPGVTFYTHISDQYAPFHTKVINAAVRDATHVMDGLLYHESDLHIEEHYTDTAGFTDHVFDLKDKNLYVHGDIKAFPTLASLIGGGINVKHIRTQWDDVLRLAGSIKQGTVTASLMLRKLGSYPRQNGLAMALRELGRIERTLFTLDWLQNVELHRRVQR